MPMGDELKWLLKGGGGVQVHTIANTSLPRDAIMIIIISTHNTTFLPGDANSFIGLLMTLRLL